LHSTRSQPSSFAANGAAPAISGGGASARQTIEANKSAKERVLRYLAFEAEVREFSNCVESMQDVLDQDGDSGV
jgi:hypothetical protein